jgi:hypothetical protein
MATIEEVENILEVYTLEEVFELNDLTEADVLFFLITEGFVTFPDPRPL